VRKKRMYDYEAIIIVESQDDVDEIAWIQAWQHLIDTGLCWKLQGWYGRQAMSLIERGKCTRGLCDFKL